MGSLECYLPSEASIYPGFKKMAKISGITPKKKIVGNFDIRNIFFFFLLLFKQHVSRIFSYSNIRRTQISRQPTKDDEEDKHCES